MDARKIPVVKVGRSGASGSPEDFENHFDRKRKIVKRSAPEHQPKLKPVENKSLSERLLDFGVGEN